MTDCTDANENVRHAAAKRYRMNPSLPSTSPAATWVTAQRRQV